MKKIGIIGSGIVGQTLGTGFLKHGYEVMVGTRDISKLEEWNQQNDGKASIGSFEETAVFGELIVVAVKGNIAADALKMAGANNLSGKTVIDANNPIADVPPEDGVLTFYTNQGESLMEQLQAEFPEVNFVKAFNSVGYAAMVNPDYDGITPTMFICGNSDAAKSEVNEILEKFGYDSADMGSARAAGAIEALCMLWCIPGFANNEWTHAFKLLRK